MQELVDNMTTEQYLNLVEIADGKVSDEIRSMTTEELYEALIDLCLEFDI